MRSLFHFHQLTECQVGKRQCSFRDSIISFDFLVYKKETPDFTSCLTHVTNFFKCQKRCKWFFIG